MSRIVFKFCNSNEIYKSNKNLICIEDNEEKTLYFFRVNTHKKIRVRSILRIIQNNTYFPRLIYSHAIHNKTSKDLIEMCWTKKEMDEYL